MNCGVGPVSAKGHQCVTGEIVGISPTLVVGGELNQHKNRGESLTSWASFWSVLRLPPGVHPVGPTLLIFWPTIGIRIGSAISWAGAHLGGVGPNPSGPWV